MVSPLAYYNSLILLNAILMSISLIIVIPTAFNNNSPPGLEILQFIYSLIMIILSYGSFLYQLCLTGPSSCQMRKARMVYTVERVLTIQAISGLLNSIAVTYRASFLAYQLPAVAIFVLSWIATVLAVAGRLTLTRHASLRFQEAKKFVEDDEPIPEIEIHSHPNQTDIEMGPTSRPLAVLPRLPEAAHSRS